MIFEIHAVENAAESNFTGFIAVIFLTHGVSSRWPVTTCVYCEAQSKRPTIH